MEDQYLRRGLRLKSVSTTFHQLAEMPGGRYRTHLSRQVYTNLNCSSSSKLAAFELKNLARFNHDSS
ncbi:hypothetical protein DA077_08235 [Lactiplantibacillus paraplantarum]|uniref:Uncharacterized protein n=1 Tax=Lactiplantibacillus paraplantarum TaxID=60520 RepID=A0AAD0X6N3_9LACO|nr:hypothetical protein DA077_08235 [Lactiplantibacillus paraplantarum]AYJ38767.1 hypothetical protein LP667_08055 [Lactiplantibacillus paraplantarum]